MTDKVVKMDVKEFRELGILQEVNRQFLHPLGLALEVTIDDDGKESISGIWDYRNDPVGIEYDITNSDIDRIKKFRKNADYVKSLKDSKMEIRSSKYGNDGIEQIPQI